MKATSAICGPTDPIIIPRGATRMDWEVELGVVIGKPAKYITEAEAIDHVAGYCVVNDVPEREFQTRRAGQWTKGKSCDNFGPGDHGWSRRTRWRTRRRCGCGCR